MKSVELAVFEEGKDKADFWLINILRHLEDEKIKKLVRDLAERVGMKIEEV